jgi:hypothetical protein
MLILSFLKYPCLFSPKYTSISYGIVPSSLVDGPIITRVPKEALWLSPGTTLTS